MRLAYADPPYPGLAHYYETHRDFAGEVDHAELLERLAAFDGWALSTSARSLPAVLAMCAHRGLVVRVAGWFRGARGNAQAHRPRAAWEPVIYTGGRALHGAPPDALICGVHARTTDPRRVIGAKPAAFAFWLFDLLGALPGDDLADLFPGSGGIGRAWELYASRSAAGRVATRRGKQLDGSSVPVVATRPAGERDGSTVPTSSATRSPAPRDGSSVAEDLATDASGLEPRRLRLLLRL